MAQTLWLSLLLRGIVAILFGLCALFWPGPTLKILIMVFGVFAIIDGFALMAAAVAWKSHHEDWGLLLVAGIGITALGVICFVKPEISAIVLLALIAARFMIAGMTEIVMAVRIRKHVNGEWMLMVDGALSFLVGLMLIAWPATGAVAMIWLFGSIALLAGAVMVVVALRYKGDLKMLEEEVKSAVEQQPSEPAAE